MKRWYYKIKERIRGPIEDEELRRLAATGIVQPATLVRKGEEGSWNQAYKVGGLFVEQSSLSPPRVALLQSQQKPAQKVAAVSKAEDLRTYPALSGVSVAHRTMALVIAVAGVIVPLSIAIFLRAPGQTIGESLLQPWVLMTVLPSMGVAMLLSAISESIALAIDVAQNVQRMQESAAKTAKLLDQISGELFHRSESERELSHTKD